MVFLIQNTQNRDSIAIHLKLDELIRAVKGARNSLVDLEDYSDEEIAVFSQEFQQFRTIKATGKLDDVIEKTHQKGENLLSK